MQTPNREGSSRSVASPASVTARDAAPSSGAILVEAAHVRAFPQEPTTDQFFDEAQWESYRALGEHIGAQLFRPIDPAKGWSPSCMIRP